MYHCPVKNCSYQVTTKGSLQIHINKIHSLEHEFKCEVCASSFADKSELKKHVTRFHYNENIGKSVVDGITIFHCMKGCSYSSQSFTNGRFLVRNHYLSHGAASKFQCALCDFSHDKQYIYLNHLKNHHRRKSNITSSENKLKVEKKQSRNMSHKCVKAGLARYKNTIII